ncbi:MAG: hypothetical protein A2600_06155 [Candidatus Lambdaproteobacteria bacterium RIFOXYD1_FULL_56_27]|uniref:DUF3341 domain-containing protein n=1 Tax=Candidatus Lambdaproteobacteria bacterium RIFOXYD2_FULL_56_26 TaxID=1817773 RepID=A0A1F6GLE0_9PROT|nr:MAG: hypothetical protein A2557_13045 [Candidatus Lambdaproteobacteria bacterium RIFOXYD2_FULL_56_26]OGH05470.1 MAG: hypothetical protein A2426_03725 [Candidatus Lambdaproteobacteria bacterium RIFOXYC1_FULL_56_13]OGH09761.1 MAG: hypothetical protein A2600_06155 [Candidatus Lambdaproteobacteria bacterium RIFOXYD1_FULL_56_27]
MSKQFSGVWATYEFLDDFCGAIRELRDSGFQRLTTLAPCPRHEIDHALGNPQSRVPFFTLAGMFCGFSLAFTLMTFMSLDWILPVSGKPIVSFPIMGPVLFELSVLCAVWFTLISMIGLILNDLRKHGMPGSKQWKSYRRFTRDRFGLIVPCTQHDLDKVEGILNKFSAEEVNREA